MRRAGRVDVVREAVAVTAYATGNYAEALRELRTVRRLSGVDAHRPMEADCERGLGRPERALAIVSESDPAKLSEHDRVELAIVASGARADLGENEAGLLVLESSFVGKVTEPELQSRLDLVKADRLEELGRTDEAAALREAAGPEPEIEDEIVVFDLEDESAETQAGGDTSSEFSAPEAADDSSGAVEEEPAGELADGGATEVQDTTADGGTTAEAVGTEPDVEPADGADLEKEREGTTGEPQVSSDDSDADAVDTSDRFEQVELDLESGEERP